MALKRLRMLIAQVNNISPADAMNMIRDGRVKINGMTGRDTMLVSDEDVITLDDDEISTRSEFAYVLFHKPRGIECTLNKNIEANLLTVFHHPLRLFPVGRLDKESEGLLLMINDGRLYHQVAHADNKREKEYYVEVHKPVTEEFLQTMRSGVNILNTLTDPCEVFPVESNPKAFRIILKQGMNRQIRRMSYNLGFSVHKLVRTRIMHMQLGDIAEGEWRNLTGEELSELCTVLKYKNPSRLRTDYL